MPGRSTNPDYDGCIRHGHWMEDAPPSTPTTVTFGYVLRCVRGCGTHVHLEIHPDTGQVARRRYDYGDGAYLRYRRRTGLTRQTSRLADLRRKYRAAAKARREAAKAKKT